MYQIWFDGLFEDDLLVVQTADQQETGMESKSGVEPLTVARNLIMGLDGISRKKKNEADMERLCRVTTSLHDLKAWLDDLVGTSASPEIDRRAR